LPFHASITVKFPSGKDLKPLALKTFAAGFPTFKHHVGELDVTFETLGLVGAVEAKSLSAVNLGVVTPFGSIKGNFSASKKLELISTRGSVDVNVALYSAHSDVLSPATKFVAVAGNSSLHANVSLLTPETTGFFPPSYFVSATSTGGPAALHFKTQPVNTSLTTDVFSKGSPAFVYLDPAYEGEFEVTSLFGKPELVVKDETKDPSGEDRKRVVELKKSWTSWTIRGDVAWAKDGLAEGEGDDAADEKPGPKPRSVKVTTLKAPSVLVLG